mmetsp:Transcript_37053/g.90056  ORF Transcript_37053/g.90056 Transcript_37053/m.90056 type:complete len:256 (+) Transcript_37053:933-1700(+)
MGSDNRRFFQRSRLLGSFVSLLSSIFHELSLCVYGSGIGLSTSNRLGWLLGTSLHIGTLWELGRLDVFGFLRSVFEPAAFDKAVFLTTLIIVLPSMVTGSNWKQVFSNTGCVLSASFTTLSRMVIQNSTGFLDSCFAVAGIANFRKKGCTDSGTPITFRLPQLWNPRDWTLTKPSFSPTSSNDSHPSQTFSPKCLTVDGRHKSSRERHWAKQFLPISKSPSFRTAQTMAEHWQKAPSPITRVVFAIRTSLRAEQP